MAAPPIGRGSAVKRVTRAAMPGAILWDVDGTLAETERDGHRRAFNEAFCALQVPWRWNEQRYGELLAVAGGRERLLHDMQTQAQAPANAHERELLAARIHRLKNEIYGAIVARATIPLRAGVGELIEECRRARIPMGIVTTTSRCNVDALLSAHWGPDWESLFAVIVTAEDAPQKKPDPQAYRLALGSLALPPHRAIAIEDSPAGVGAAGAAGVPVVAARSHYFASSPFPPALAIGSSLDDPNDWRPNARLAQGRIGLMQIDAWAMAAGLTP